MSIKISDLEPGRRDAVLNAALKEFVSKGFDKASTNIIAKDAGMSKALMFHYVKSKQDLFLYVYDYFSELLEEQYFSKLNFSEREIFARLRQSYLLQIELIKQYPGILELDKLAAQTKSEILNRELQKRVDKSQSSCLQQMFAQIDVSKFKAGMDIEKCKQIILWTNTGLTNQILEEITKVGFDHRQIISTIDKYFDELRKMLYE